MSALEAFFIWRLKTVRERVAALKLASQAFTLRAEEFAELISKEVGKPIFQSRFEVSRATEEWEYMLKNAEKFLEPEQLEGAQVCFDPLGVVAVISPWNFPVMLPLRGIIPALLAGNSVIFKPSELSLGVGVALAGIFSSDVPLFVAPGGKELGAEVVAAPVAAVAFTGSSAVGKSIAREASHSLKRMILELGGLDAAIVLQDADVEMAAYEIVRNNARNSGQVCNAVKRVLVHESVHDRFLSAAIEAAKQLIYGDPLSEATEVGPLVSEAQHERVKSFFDDAVSKGSKYFQVPAPIQSAFFGQAILWDVPDTALLLKDEPFGPLLPVVKFSSEEQAINIANDTRFGLSASIWTSDLDVFKRLASQLDVGLVRRNIHAAMQPGIPWGGCKESGVGRMKTKEGLREFTNIKVIA
jgi:acyl-CoA reductase-like NAD-dependent aldehyde dehydrogenase